MCVMYAFRPHIQQQLLSQSVHLLQARLYFETLQMWGALLSAKPDRAATVMRFLVVSSGRRCFAVKLTTTFQQQRLQQ